MDNVDDMVESYLNGNITLVKVWLKKASKNDVLAFAEGLDNNGHRGLFETRRLLR